MARPVPESVERLREIADYLSLQSWSALLPAWADDIRKAADAIAKQDTLAATWRDRSRSIHAQSPWTLLACADELDALRHDEA